MLVTNKLLPVTSLQVRVVSQQAIVELTIAGMTSESDAKGVRKDLEWVSGVERALVDHASGKAKVLMKKGVGLSDLADRVVDLMDAVDKPCSVTGSRCQWHKSSTINLKW